MKIVKENFHLTVEKWPKVKRVKYWNDPYKLELIEEHSEDEVV